MQPQPAREQIRESTARACEALSHLDEPCNAPAMTRCEKCQRWFCSAHAEDAEWHTCVLDEGDIGGEA